MWICGSILVVRVILFVSPSFIRIQTLRNIQISFDCEKRLDNLVGSNQLNHLSWL